MLDRYNNTIVLLARAGDNPRLRMVLEARCWLSINCPESGS
jgi:hypothetical protein